MDMIITERKITLFRIVSCGLLCIETIPNHICTVIGTSNSLRIPTGNPATAGKIRYGVIRALIRMSTKQDLNKKMLHFFHSDSPKMQIEQWPPVKRHVIGCFLQDTVAAEYVKREEEHGERVRSERETLPGSEVAVCLGTLGIVGRIIIVKRRHHAHDEFINH